MRKYHFSLTVVLFFHFCFSAIAQKAKSTTPNRTNSLSTVNSENQLLANQLFDKYYYVVVKLKELPTQNSVLPIQKAGIVLLDFVSTQTYWAKIPLSIKSEMLKDLGIEKVYELNPKTKISPDIIESSALSAQIEVDILVAKGIEKLALANKLTSMGVELLSFSDFFSLAKVRMKSSQVGEVAQLPFVAWIDISEKKVELLANPARENYRTGIVENMYGLTGKGVLAGVWDGGYAGAHIDFMGRTTQVQPTTNICMDCSNHATRVVGLMAGAGLRDPSWAGVATEASVLVYDYLGNVPSEMLAAVDASKIVITQNSYGGDPILAGTCGTGASYSSYSRTMDALAYNHPYLTHHFAIGNSRNNCAGAAPANSGYRSTAVGFNNAKNIITVGGINNNNEILNIGGKSSAWGPFMDGRIAPIVTAFGQHVTSTEPPSVYAGFARHGTSFACPIVSGVSALLYQRFRQLNANANPNSSLIRALVANGADDLGNPFPDYQFGFGKLNALKSVKMLNQGNYIEGSVTQAATQTYTAQINVPANTRRLKAMLSWTDPPSLPTNGTALINNLNMQVRHDVSSATFDPWVLNPAMPAATAMRGLDLLNNLEQVTIDDPAAGTYTITVTGAAINFPAGGTQNFSIVWLVEPEYIEVTYPSGKEKVLAPIVERIHWDAEGMSNVFDIEFYNGSAWNPIVTGLKIAAGFPNQYDWINMNPSIITDQAKIRVTGTKTVGGATISDESDLPFTIMAVPKTISAAAGNTQITVGWAAVSGADSYDIYKIRQFDNFIGDAQYQFVANVPAPATSYISQGLTNGVGYFHTVVARTNAGVTSARGYASDLTIPVGVGAAIDLQPTAFVSPIVATCVNNPSITVKVKNVGTNTIVSGTVIPISYQIDALPIVNESLTLAADLLANQEINYTFTALPNFSAVGSYSINVNANLATDGVKDNNQLSQTIQRDAAIAPMSITASVGSTCNAAVTLTAKDYPINSYTINNSIPFAAEDMTAATPVTLGDDDFIGLPIGFSFSFLGKNYTNFFIGSNGYIGFDDNFALPPNNYIALASADLDPSAGGTIKYQVFGTVPNRRLAVEFANVPYYGSMQRVSGQVIIYEGSNAINLKVINIGSDGSPKTMGVASGQQQISVFVSGRNNTVWTAINEDWNLTPTNNTLLWSNGQTTPTISVSNAGTYSFTVSKNSCTYSASTTLASSCPDLVVNTAQTTSGNFNNVTITGTGTLTLNGNINADGNFSVQSGGKLITSCNPITGNGVFTLQTGAIMEICNTAGITASGATGDVQLTGTRTFSTDANYIYKGTVAQVTGNGLPNPVLNLSIDNANGVTLSQNTGVKRLLTLTEGNLISNGRLTILSNATQTAMVVQKVDGSNAVIGNATVERHVTGGQAVYPAAYSGVGGYHYFSPSISNGTVAQVSDDLALVLNPAYDFVVPYSGAFPNFYFYNNTRIQNTTPNDVFEKGWYSPANTAQALNQQQGFILNISAGNTVDMTGTLNNGDLPNIPLAKGTPVQADWHLLGNPYPAPISWTEVAKLNPTSPTDEIDFTVLRRIPTGQYEGTWAYYMASNPPDVTMGIGTNTGTSLEGDKIAMGQGFFVKVKKDNTAYKMTNRVRYTTFENPTFFKTEQNETIKRNGLIKLGVSQGKYADETAIYFEESAKPWYDKYDAEKARFNSQPVPSIFTVSEDNKSLAINGLPSFREEFEIPLSIYGYSKGTYSIRLNEINFFQEFVQVYLEDKQLDILHNLTQNPDYQFSVSNVGFQKDRFVVRFSKQVNEKGGLDYLSLFPNPNNGELNLRMFSSYQGNVTINVYDVIGKMHKSLTINKNTNRFEGKLDLREMVNGIYLIEIIDDFGKKIRKIVKE